MANGIRLSRLRRDIKRERVVVPYTEIADKWYSNWNPLTKMNPKFWDNEYTALPIEVWKDILQYSGIDKYRYMLNRSDCDKFAMGLKAMVALKLKVNGVLLIADYKAGHAFCGLLESKNGEWMDIPIVEPQTDRFIDNPKENKMYQLVRGDVIF